MIESFIENLAQRLVEARKERRQIAGLPADQLPHSASEAYAVQDVVLRRLGPAKGWKVGAANPTAEPACAPIWTILESPCVQGWGAYIEHGIELEAAVRFGKALPPRSKPYAREEVLDAIDAVMPAIEIVDSRYKDFQKMDRLAQLADNQSNGALVVGAPLKDWKGLKLDALKAKLSVGGKLLVETVGGNTAGDPVRPLTWLASVLSPRRHRIEVGTIVTTGALTGMRFVEKPSAIKGEIEGLGTVELTFSA